MVKKMVYALLVVLLIIGAWLITNNFEGVTKTGTTKVDLNYRVEAEFQPEIASINLGVETKKNNVNAAMKENNKRMQTIIDNLKTLEEVSVDTTSFQVRPVTVEEMGKQVVYYRVINQIRVKTERINNTGSIIQKAIAAGANRVLSIEYSLENPRKIRRQVIERGIKGIKDKAEFTALKMDKTVFKIDSMDINDQYINNLKRDFQYQITENTPEKTAGIPPISPQKVKVSVNIRATFLVQ